MAGDAVLVENLPRRGTRRWDDRGRPLLRLRGRRREAGRRASPWLVGDRKRAEAGWLGFFALRRGLNARKSDDDPAGGEEHEDRRAPHPGRLEHPPQLMPEKLHRRSRQALPPLWVVSRGP